MRKLLLIISSLLLTSCGVSTAKYIGKKPLFEVLTQQTNGGANIRFFEILTEEKEIVMLQNDEHLKKKIKSDDLKNSNFIVFNMGEKATSGYKIGIENAVETDKNIIITIKEYNTSSTAVPEITTPYAIVKINSKKDIIIQ